MSKRHFVEAARYIRLRRPGPPRATPRSGFGQVRAGAAREAARQAGVSGKRSESEGGGRAGKGAGGSVGRPRWPRIWRSTSAASIVAMTDMRPPQRGHARTSRAKTRRIKSAHLQSRGFSGEFGCFASRVSLGGAVAETSTVGGDGSAPALSVAGAGGSPGGGPGAPWATARARA